MGHLSSSRDQLQIIGHDQCDHTVTRQQNPITKDEKLSTYACGAILT
jgi:hypothetical protein